MIFFTSQGEVQTVIPAINIRLQTTSSIKFSRLTLIYETTRQLIPMSVMMMIALDMSSGLSRGIQTFIIFQSSSFVKVARKRKKNQKNPVIESFLYVIYHNPPRISISVVYLTLKANPTSTPARPSNE